MKQSSQSESFQNFNTTADSSNEKKETSSQYLLMAADAVIKRMLTSANSSQTNDFSTNISVRESNLKTSECYTWKKEDIEHILNLPPLKKPPHSRVSLHALQEWEGYIVSIEEDEFVARLIDITAGEKYETEEATIPLEEISEYDRTNLELGSIFRWVIGYECLSGGTRKRVSEIVFRDFPRLTKSELQASKEWAREILAEFTS